MSQNKLIQILDLARWAPSGDNTQPWRFEIVGELQIRVYGHDTRDHVLYDFDGHPSHIAHGALLETMRIAATGFGLTTRWVIQSTGEDRQPIYTVHFTETPGTVRDPLFACIESRMVQRRPMKTTPLSPTQRQELRDAAGPDFDVSLYEQFGQRSAIARLLWNSAKIRLTCPEAYPVHRDIIEWHAQFSKDRIPEQAVGVDPATAHLMQWVMQSWTRVEFFNSYLLGTVLPRIQLDWLPALRCAAHLLVCPKRPPAKLADWLALGAAVQRIWLTATQQGLHLQPQMTPVIFRWYAGAGRRFSAKPALFEQALAVSGQFERVVDMETTANFGFFARVGVSAMPKSRSVRLDMTDLMHGKSNPKQLGSDSN